MMRIVVIITTTAACRAVCHKNTYCRSIMLLFISNSTVASVWEECCFGHKDTQHALNLLDGCSWGTFVQRSVCSYVTVTRAEKRILLKHEVDSSSCVCVPQWKDAVHVVKVHTYAPMRSRTPPLLNAAVSFPPASLLCCVTIRLAGSGFANTES